jgi:hypothetical protein
MIQLCLSLLAALMVQSLAPTRPQDTGVVTGVIKNVEGRPAAHVRVFATPSKESSRDQFAIEAQVETDAEGRYRLALPPGQYFIGAGFIDLAIWYPGTANIGAAKRIDVSTNAAIAIDITSQGPMMNGSIQVQTVSSASGSPLPGVEVNLSGTLDPGPVASGQPRPFIAIRPTTKQTDAAGIATFRNLAGGRYFVVTRIPGYYSPLAMSLELSGNNPSPQIQLKMVPSTIISGFVQDTAGKPMRTEVWAGRLEYRDGHRQVVRESTQFTDDHGHYTLVITEPGSYFVAAEPPGGLSRPGLESTYYPGTRLLDDAMPVTVRHGETLGGLVLIVPAVQSSR